MAYGTPPGITTVTALPPVGGGVNTFDVDEGRAALAFDVTMQPVAQRLASLLDGVTFTVNARSPIDAGAGPRARVPVAESRPTHSTGRR